MTTNLIPKFSVDQVVEVVCGGYGLSPDRIGQMCTINSVDANSERVCYRVSFIGEFASTAWEQSFKEIVTPVPANLTPAQAKGFIVGKTRLELKNHGDSWAGKVWLLREDDKTDCPYFKSECGEIRNICFSVSDLSIIEETPIESGYTELQTQALNTFQAMYDAAIKYRTEGSSRLNSDYGICDNIDRFADSVGANSRQMTEVKENLIRTTASYSGTYTYPVKGVDGDSAERSYDNHSSKWQGDYGLNRLQQLGELIAIIKSDKWTDDFVLRQTPAFRNGLKVGDVVQYTRSAPYTLWVLRRDDESTSPSFHRLGNEDSYNDIDLSHIKKIDKDMIKERSVSEFLSLIGETVTLKTSIEQQIEELKKQLENLEGEISLLDYGLAQQHKVKRI